MILDIWNERKIEGKIPTFEATIDCLRNIGIDEDGKWIEQIDTYENVRFEVLTVHFEKRKMRVRIQDTRVSSQPKYTVDITAEPFFNLFFS